MRSVVVCTFQLPYRPRKPFEANCLKGTLALSNLLFLLQNNLIQYTLYSVMAAKKHFLPILVYEIKSSKCTYPGLHRPRDVFETVVTPLPRTGRAVICKGKSTVVNVALWLTPLTSALLPINFVLKLGVLCTNVNVLQAESFKLRTSFQD